MLSERCLRLESEAVSEGVSDLLAEGDVAVVDWVEGYQVHLLYIGAAVSQTGGILLIWFFLSRPA